MQPTKTLPKSGEDLTIKSLAHVRACLSSEPTTSNDPSRSNHLIFHFSRWAGQQGKSPTTGLHAQSGVETPVDGSQILRDVWRI